MTRRGYPPLFSNQWLEITNKKERKNYEYANCPCGQPELREDDII